MGKTSFKNFLKLKPMRKQHINDASSEPKEYKFLANEIASINHPKVQHVVITKIEDITGNIRRYTLSPNVEAGTSRLAPFKPGQYISVKYQIGKVRTARPYSICSWNGDYQITIKKDENGLTSKYAFENWSVGTEIDVSAPEGWFCYQPLRDQKNIVALAGGSGITPFLSLAKSIEAGYSDINLTLVYGCRTRNDIAFKDEFDSISSRCNKFKVVYVLSDEECDGYAHGFITKDLIKKNTNDFDKTSFFICGPKAMYESVLNSLNKLGVDRRHIRCEVLGEAHSINDFADCPKDLKKSVEITVKIQDEIFKVIADTSKTILRNLEDAGIAVLNKCRSGVCGFCHSSLIKGEVFIPGSMDALREADKLYNQIHLCCAYALTDVTIIVAKA